MALDRELWRWMPDGVSLHFTRTGFIDAPVDIDVCRDLNNHAEIAAAVRAAGGVMTAEDLAAYRPVLREPVRGTYRGYEIVSMPPPSSGGVIICEILNVLEGYPLAYLGPDMQPTVDPGWFDLWIAPDAESGVAAAFRFD